MDGKKLKYFSEINYQNPILRSKRMKFLLDKKEENKNIHFKQLNFNPTSYFLEKYSSEITNGINKKKIFGDISKNELKDNNNIINKYDSTRKKLKLKPLNMNKANYSTIFHPKIDDILIPSKKTSKDLVDYNKSNAHNTLLNYYHKNNRNVKIINFVKSNSFEKNLGLNISSNESINVNNKPQIPEYSLKRKPQLKSSFPEVEHPIKRGRNFRKSAVEIYEAEIFAKKDLMRNLIYFHSYFFDKNDKNKSRKLNPVFKEDNQIISDKITLPDPFTKKIDLDNLNKDRYGSSSNFTKSRNRRRMKNEKNNLSYKEIRNLSIRGFQRMKANKKRQLNLRLKNTNNEVLNLEHKLDELLEINKNLFLNAE